MVKEGDYYFSMIERDNTNIFHFNDERFRFGKLTETRVQREELSTEILAKRILVKITRHYHAVKNTTTTSMKVVKNTERRAIMHREARGITCTSNCQATNFASLSLQPCKTRNVSAEPRFRVVLYSAIETRAKCFLPRCLLLLVQGNLEIANEWQRILFQVNSTTNFSLKIYLKS